jgi:Sigma-70, region 4
MRKRDSKHQAQLASIQPLGPPELIRRIGIGDHNDSSHIASEVLATLIRNRFGQADGVVGAAVEELNRRIQVLVGKRMRGMMGQPEVARRGDQALPDTIDYVWDRFFEETVVISNAEVRFAVFVRDRVDDFMRHLRADKNSMESVDAMIVSDKEGNTTPFIDTVEDTDADNPEQALASKQQNAKVVIALMALPKVERNAFYFRAEFKYEWKKVAELLGCSIPTANKHFAAAMEKLEGALE